MKIAYSGPETKPTPAPSRRERETDGLIRQLVRAAPSGAAAWNALGVESTVDEDGGPVTTPVLMSPERMAANNRAMEVDHRIAQGWDHIAKAGKLVPRAWIDRLVELHDESQDRLFELDAVRIAEAAVAGRQMPDVFGCLLQRASVEADGYLRDRGEPPSEVGAALDRMGRAIESGKVEVMRHAAKKYVEAAARARYGEGVSE